VSWEDQGRQDLGWFGDGTSAADTALFAPPAVAARVQVVIHGSVGALPASSRKHPAAQPTAAERDRLTSLMTDWSRAAALSPARFADLFFGRQVDERVVEQLRDAAVMADKARSHVELREAAEALASAQQLVGLDRWSRFVAEAERHANDPVTIENVAMATKLAPPLHRREEGLGHPHPVEAVLAAGAALITGGASAVAIVVGRKMLDQIVPKPKETPTEPTPAAEGMTAARTRQNPPSEQPIVGKPKDGSSGTEPTLAVTESGALPNASKVRISREEIDGYSLKPENEGGPPGKARVFESALGFNKSNADDLISQIRSGVRKNPAITGELDEFGQRFRVDIPLGGPKGSAIVRTGWIIDPGSTIPRLLTAFVKQEYSMSLFQEHEAVVLKQDILEDGVKKGMVGHVICVFTAPSIAYEVEFADKVWQSHRHSHFERRSDIAIWPRGPLEPMKSTRPFVNTHERKRTVRWIPWAGREPGQAKTATYR
jgi:hypothetical protein